MIAGSESRRGLRACLSTYHDRKQLLNGPDGISTGDLGNRNAAMQILRLAGTLLPWQGGAREELGRCDSDGICTAAYELVSRAYM